ncbi:MAG TPA: polyamine aminopropyltransferase [Chloroflexota bacterium]|nr:polyamine aminopropyltransferase [Chloroflexota bacterium]
MASWFQEKLYPSVAQAFEIETLFETRSPYQHILIGRNDVVGRMLILDGVVQITEADSAVYQEMMTHVPLMGLERAARRVLVVGGGDGCMAREALRHPSVERVTMVELDQMVVDACKEWMPSVTADYADPRLELAIEDAAEYVTRAPAEAFDAVLCDSPDPIGPAEVLFGSPFYTDIRRILTPQGAAVFQSGVPFFQADETAGIVQRLSALFAQVAVYQAAVPTYYGGSMALVLASKSPRPFDQPREDFRGQFYNAALHRAAFALPSWWQDKLLPKPKG